MGLWKFITTHSKKCFAWVTFPWQSDYYDKRYYAASAFHDNVLERNVSMLIKDNS